MSNNSRLQAILYSVADSQVNLGGGTLTLSASQVNGTLSGAGSLNLASGNTTFGGNNANLSAAVVIEQPAIVTLMQSNGLGSGSLQLKGGLVLAGNTPSTLNKVISGAGTLTSNNGTWTLNQNSTFTGGTTLGANGNLTLLASGAAGTGGIANGGTLTLGGDANTAFTLANALTGSGALVKNGGGTWTIDRDNTFTGSTTVSGGNLIVTRTGALGTGAIINNGTLTLNGVHGAADTPPAAFANTLTGSGSLIVNNNSNVRINALSGFGGRFTVDQGSQLSTELAAIDSHLSDSVVNGTLNVTTRAESGLLLNRLITGQGTVNLSVNNANATYGLAGFDGFTGTVNLTNGKYLLDNTTLNKAQLVSNQGNVITLGEHITTTGALNINGGTLDLGKQPPVTATSLAMNSGTLKADLGHIVPSQGNANNLFSSGSIYIRTLLHAQNGLTGSYGNLTLADSHGAGTTPFVDLLKDADGNTLGTARWGVTLGQQGNDLNLNWGLQNISLTPGKSLSLKLADSGSTQSTFDATLEGTGGVNINAAGGAITFNGANTYTGATSLTAGTLNLKADNTLGNTSGLIAAAGTTVNLLENSTQTLNNLDSKAGSQLNLGGGTLTLKGGQIEGALSGNVSGTLAFADGKSTLGNSNTGLNAKIDIQKAATVTLRQASGLGTGISRLTGCSPWSTSTAT
ncbi:autotransporter-associated beta strand repeat-containing protein [Yersinia ruckeri]|uniref:beta strand repeat-containing protein n=1 Tax=Yersinia ruckeri TaxID=29486 RepID=UPI001F199DE9